MNPSKTPAAKTAGSNAPALRVQKGKPTMKIKVYSPFRVYFDDLGFSISAVNDTGAFDILPRHHNFMTLLNPGIVEIKYLFGSQKIRIARGVMHVKADSVTVFLDV